jgi:hypothetical protein
MNAALPHAGALVASLRADAPRADTASGLLARCLGAAFLAVFAISLASGLLSAAPLSGDAAAALSRVPDNTGLLRASAMLLLLTSVGIVTLSALLYAVLGPRSRPLGLIAFGWWLAEGTMLAVSSLGLLGLLRVGTGTAEAGAATAADVALARVLLGIHQDAFTIHMLFFCLGGVVWYALMDRSGLVPKWLAGWGVVGATLLLVVTLANTWDRSLSLGVFAVAAMVIYVPFEPALGIWLTIQGDRRMGVAIGPERRTP